MTPSTSTAWFSPTPAPPPPALAPVPAPPLKALLEDGFGLLALLRNGAWPQREDFRARLEALLGQFERRAQALGKPPEAVQEAKYAFCALADEILLGADSPLRDSWGGAPLQLSLFGEHLAGEGFFRRLEQLRQDPAARHAAAATPIQNGAAARLPATGGEFAQDGVPLPPDALGKGRVVEGQIAFRAPVVRRSRRAIEKALPQLAKGRDFLRGPELHARPPLREEKKSRSRTRTRDEDDTEARAWG